MKAIVNTTVILEDGFLLDGAVLFDESGICAVGPRHEMTLPEGTEVMDAGGGTIPPRASLISTAMVGTAGFSSRTRWLPARTFSPTARRQCYPRFTRA